MLFKKEGMSKFLFILNNLQKTYIKIQFYSKSFERIAHFLWAEEQMSDLLKKSVICSFSLLSWAPWSNCSWLLFCHEQPERFAHCRSFVLSNLSDLLTVAHLSWAIWVICSQSRANEWWANDSVGNSLICLLLIRLLLIRSLLICSFAHCSFAHLLICSNRLDQMSNCEQFAQIAQDKWATVSKLLRSLRTNEQLWGNPSGCSWQKSNHEWFAQVAHDKWANEGIGHFFNKLLFHSQKTSDLLKKIQLKSYFVVPFM